MGAITSEESSAAMAGPCNGRAGRKRGFARLAGVIVVVTVISQAVGAARDPRWNWDVVGYVGCAFEFHTQDRAEVLSRTRTAIKAELPAEVAADLLDGDTYRATVMRQPERFESQLGFYRGRWFYTMSVAVLIHLGCPATTSTVAVSIAAAVGLILVLITWLTVHGSFSWAVFATVLTLLVVPVFDTARSSSPDTLAALFAVAGIALATGSSRASVAGGLSLWSLAIGARTDMVVLVAAVAVALAIAARTKERRFMAIGSVIVVAVLAGVTHRVSGWHGWSTVFHHTFTGPLTDPASEPPTVSWGQFVDQLGAGFSSRGRDRALGTVVAGLVVAGFARRRSREAAWVVLGTTAALGLHYLAFPVFWKRFFVAHSVVILGVAWIHVLPRPAWTRSGASTNASVESSCASP